MVKRIALLLAFILGLSAPVLAAEPGSGIIDGSLVNRTEGGSSVANQEITLMTYLDNAEAGTATAKTDSVGHFIFDGLSTDSGYSYEVKLTFQQAEYYSERLAFNDGQTRKSTEVTVYDSTTNDKAIRVAMTHSVVYVELGSLRVVEYYLFVNEADRTYIGSKEVAEGTRETLRLPLPNKATELQVGSGLMECCIVGSEDGFVDTMPVLPGVKEVAYGYRISNGSGTYSFSRNVNYPTASYNLLVQGEGVEVASNQLTAGEPMEIEGMWFNQLSGQELTVDETVVARLSGLPYSNNRGTILWVVLALVVLGAGAGFTYLMRRGKLQPVDSEGNLDRRRQRLLIELAQLDDDFEGGKITKEIYHRLRAARKAELIELMPGAKGESGRQ